MNLFIYGTLALKEKQEELGVTFSKIIEYDYIKGKSLIEITDDGTYFAAVDNPIGIINGKILIDINEDYIPIIDNWEGDNYIKQQIITVVNKINCLIYIKK